MVGKQKNKRKTYSIASARSLELAHSATNLTEELNVTVSRQAVLDALVECLSDKAVFNKVKSIIKKND